MSDTTDITLYAEDMPGHAAQIDAYTTAGLDRMTAFSLEVRAAKVQTLGRKTILEIGSELLAAREEAQHGTWGPFLTRCGLEERTARNYMQVAERFGDKSEIISALPPTVLYAMASPSADQVAVSEIIAEVEAGKPAPSVAAVRERVRPAPPPPPPAPAAPAGKNTTEHTRPAPTPPPPPAAATMPPALQLTPAPTPAAPPPLALGAAVAQQVDAQARKALTAKVALLEASLQLARAQLVAQDGPVFSIAATTIMQAAQAFVGNPALNSAAALLAFSAVEVLDAEAIGA